MTFIVKNGSYIINSKLFKHRGYTVTDCFWGYFSEVQFLNQQPRGEKLLNLVKRNMYLKTTKLFFLCINNGYLREIFNYSLKYMKVDTFHTQTILLSLVY